MLVSLSEFDSLKDVDLWFTIQYDYLLCPLTHAEPANLGWCVEGDLWEVK